MAEALDSRAATTRSTDVDLLTLRSPWVTDRQIRSARRPRRAENYFRRASDRGIGPRSSVLVMHRASWFVGESPQHLRQRAVDVETAVAAIGDDGPDFRRRRADLQELQQAQLLEIGHFGHK